MPIILNKFRNHQVNPQTEILILGVFNPYTEDAPDFFYGKSRNFLWHMLPQCWGLASLQDANLQSKQEFMLKYKIDFADVIDAIELPQEEDKNPEETLIDSHVQQWKDLVGLVDSLPKLKAVYFTRKTFNGISNIRTQLSSLARHCAAKDLRICKLDNPARFYSQEKLQQWKDTIVLQKTCLRI